MLEIHVLIQVGCTVIIFLCWWNKPLDVNEPIRLPLRNKQGELRPLNNKEEDVLLQEEVVELGPDWKQHPSYEQHSKSRLLPEDQPEEGILDLGAYSEQQPIPRQHPNSEHLNLGKHPDSQLHHEDMIEEVDLCENPEQQPNPKQHPDSEQHPDSNQHPKSKLLQQKQPEEQLEVVLDLDTESEQYPDSQRHPKSKQHQYAEELENIKLPLQRDYVITRRPPCLIAMSDRALYDIIVNLTGADVKMMLLEGLFIAIIAGLHATAWNVHFPTKTEALLWKLACIGMFVCPLAVIAVASRSSKSTPYHVGLARNLWHNHQVQYTNWQWMRQAVVTLYELAEVQAWDAEEGYRTQCIYVHLLFLVICLLLLAGYLVCILYITGASYISLRDPPDRTFETPKWSDYWPHL